MTEDLKIIDEKDRKILAELDKNSGETDSDIAKKVRLSKQVVNYRIQKLVEKGIIERFYTIINTGNFGLNSFYIFLQFQKLNKEKEKILLEKINSLDYVGWLVHGTGRWDCIVQIYSGSIFEFNSFLNNILKICGENLHEYNFTTLLTGEHLSYKFITGSKGVDKIIQTEKREKIKIDEIDKKILKVLSQNARLSLVDISKKSNVSLHKVNYHLDKLTKNKIIEGFKPKINSNKLNYEWNLLLIQFQNINEKRKNEFLEYCKNNSKIYYVTTTVGVYNLMLDIYVKNVEEFREVLFELKEKFSDVIKIYESMIIFKEFKINYFPEKLINP
ncbi:Lrp/AsnC family transcriptional regulator [Candidatus Pacearchaeota archaeon]|nr:Lrp/AsnC family transcriptional regulator [Candidatus Pacearchaeota archaeon]